MMVGCSGVPAVSPSPSPAPSSPSPSPAPSITASPSPTTTPTAQVYTFDDGALTIEVPPGALPDGVQLVATQRGPEDRPPELADIQMSGTFYSLEPDGLTFAQPITINRRVAVADTGVDIATKGLPLITLALRTSDGQWEWLAEQAITTDGEFIYIAGKASHTSQLFGFSAGNYAEDEWDGPQPVEVGIDGVVTHRAKFTAPLDAPTPPEISELDNDAIFDLFQDDFGTGAAYQVLPYGEPFTHTGVLSGQTDVFNSTGWSDLPENRRSDAMPQAFQQFSCLELGTFFTPVGYEVVGLGAGNSFYRDQLGLGAASTTVFFGTEVTCIDGEPGIADEVTLQPDRYADATAPYSAVTLDHDEPFLVITLASPPVNAPGSFSTQFKVNRPDYHETYVECRFFGSVRNCVETDQNGAVVGEPGPAGTANVDGPWSMAVSFSELVDFLEGRTGGPLESLTPVKVIYSDADGKVGGGLFDEAAQAQGRDWLGELIGALTQ